MVSTSWVVPATSGVVTDVVTRWGPGWTPLTCTV